MKIGIFYIVLGIVLLCVFPLRYMYTHYIRKESHVMNLGKAYRTHWLLELMQKVTFAIAFFGSFVVSIMFIMYGLKILVG
jgi:ABC-type glycerol-3-phosphate transport system permease component